jgi:hypothetical protein
VEEVEMKRFLVFGFLVLFVSIASISTLFVSATTETGRMQPLTDIVLSPPEPNGNCGWYTIPVGVSFVDASGPVEYRINDSDWIEYTAPFTITIDGRYVISYYSGNESIQNASVWIDQTPPYAYGDNMSGLDRVEFYVVDPNGNLTLAFNDTDGTDGYSWTIHPIPKGEDFKIAIGLYDIAGNTAWVNYTLTRVVGTIRGGSPYCLFALYVYTGIGWYIHEPLPMCTLVRLGGFHGYMGKTIICGIYLIQTK